jgi:hypothetical protein
MAYQPTNLLANLATWKFLEESGNPEMAFDNYRITIPEFSHISPKRDCFWKTKNAFVYNFFRPKKSNSL